ncbi:MAG: YlxR family protein [Candidatus Eremiobacteraeota bacterium]|nr:YlxR family protein [Candidatus Eremiobacteraeota bacterium]
MRTPNGWQADPAGRGVGRGAYLCSPECARAVKKNKRYRALADPAATTAK